MRPRTSPLEMRKALAAAVLLAAPYADSVQAYVGPGLGVGAIGVLLGVAGSLLVAVMAFVYYPIRRWLRGRKPPPPEAEDTAGPRPPSGDEPGKNPDGHARPRHRP